MHAIHSTEVPDLQSPEEQEGQELSNNLISNRLHGFFVEQGLPRHKHSSQLATILGLSRSGAFRKFQDGSFSSGDLQSLAEHFQVDIRDLLSESNKPADSAATDAVHAQITVGGMPIACLATIGAALQPNEHCELVAIQQGNSWAVVPFRTERTPPRFHVLQVEITPAQRQLPRLAILEDSSDLANNLKEAFEVAGFRAELFTTAAALEQAAKDAPFDAYIADWWLHGQPSAGVLKTIRAAQPLAPIVLTTGAIASGNAAEDEIASLTLGLRITVVEKPFRLALLIAQVKERLVELT